MLGCVRHGVCALICERRRNARVSVRPLSRGCAASNGGKHSAGSRGWPQRTWPLLLFLAAHLDTQVRLMTDRPRLRHRHLRRLSGSHALRLSGSQALRLSGSANQRTHTHTPVVPYNLRTPWHQHCHTHVCEHGARNVGRQKFLFLHVCARRAVQLLKRVLYAIQHLLTRVISVASSTRLSHSFTKRNNDKHCHRVEQQTKPQVVGQNVLHTRSGASMQINALDTLQCASGETLEITAPRRAARISLVLAYVFCFGACSAEERSGHAPFERLRIRCVQFVCVHFVCATQFLVVLLACAYP